MAPFPGHIPALERMLKFGLPEAPDYRVGPVSQKSMRNADSTELLSTWPVYFGIERLCQQDFWAHPDVE